MNEKQHLTTLRMLLVLTFITAGLNFFSYAITAFVHTSFKQILETNTDMFPAEMHTMLDMFLSLPRGYFAVAALLYALELAGGVLMWRLHRAGFHCYTLSRLLLLLVPLLFIGREYVGIGNVMFALLFIASYWLLLRALGVFGNQPPTPPATTDNSAE